MAVIPSFQNVDNYLSTDCPIGKFWRPAIATIADMQVLFLVPTLLYGVLFFFNGGSPIFLAVSVATVAIWIVLGSQREIDQNGSVSFIADRVYIGDRRLSRFPWLWPTKMRNKVYRAAFQLDPDQILEKLPDNRIGLGPGGEFVAQPIGPKCPHGILIGPTGSGKTELARLVADRFGSTVWAVDFKGGSGFREHPRVSRLFTNQGSDGPLLLEEELQRREQGEYFEPLLIVVDELGEVLRTPRWLATLESVAAKGRSFGMHLLLCNQTLGQIPRTIWGNCGFRAGLQADQIDLAQLGIKGESKSKQSHGHALYAINGAMSSMWFPLGAVQRKTASVVSEAANPLLKPVSRPRLAPYAEFAQAHQSPSDPWLGEEQPEPLDLLGHRRGNTDQRHRERYSKTL